MLGLRQTKEVAIADNAGAVQRRHAEIKYLRYRHGHGDTAAGKAIDQMPRRSERCVPDSNFRPAQFELRQVTRQIDLRRARTQRTKTQCLRLKCRPGEIELRLRAKPTTSHFTPH